MLRKREIFQLYLLKNAWSGKVFFTTSQKQKKMAQLLDCKKLINSFKLPALKYPDIYFKLENKVLGEAVFF
jgi:hypothetical protein